MTQLAFRERLALEALCRRFVPAAYHSGADLVGLATQVDARLQAGDPVLHRRVALILRVIDHPLSGLVFLGQPRRFSSLRPLDQDACLTGWSTSRIPLRRTMFQALRRLILSTYYALPATHEAIGYAGPFYRRDAIVPWEGTLDGQSIDAEPIARAIGTGEEVQLPRTGRFPKWVDFGRPSGRITHGHELPYDTRLIAEACVIGSGAGGAVAAARLAESGLDVVILEEGGHYAGNGFTESEAEMMPALYADAGMRATDDLSVQILQGRTIGGGSTVNWLVMLRTPDWVLQEWMFEHGAEGMSASELAPIFERVERETHTRAVPNDAHSPNNRMILEGASALGWHAAVASINAKGCVRSGFCGLGCRYGAKQGALATYIPSALRGGARIFSDVRAERIEIVGRAGKAGGNPLKRVHATVLDRHTARPRGRLTVDAPIVVLAGGAVGTPTLLQRSGMGGGGVGDYLRLHPTTTVIGIHDREIYGAGGIPLSAICDQFVRGDGSGYGFWIECPPMHPGLASVAMSGFGEPHREMMIRFPRLGALIVLVRDGADRTLSSGRVWVDPTGRTRIRYRLSETDLVQMREGIVAAARLQLAAGAREVVTLHTPPRSIRGESDLSALATADCSPNRLGLFSAHVNGTCRFGTDPRTSGCTPDGQRHGVRGLYVADGSLLPTALGVNPQETIMAVATVVAGRITGK